MSWRPNGRARCKRSSWSRSTTTMRFRPASIPPRLKAVTGVSAKITVLPPDTLPRATHKAKRVEDRRTSVWN
ncbi:hypothetical protein [Rhodopseudomonas sp.]|uniref:hypothetical protein n=1 Tax=Rhodopseudomonas sp. TaxID=1078 RepID=UPI003451A513